MTIVESRKKLKGAIIGFGHQGQKEYLPKFLNASNSILVAVCDNNHNVSKNLFNTSVNFYTDYTKMIEKENIEFCVISLPHATHNKIVVNLLKKNIPILKEKPLSINFREALEINRATELYKTPIILPLFRRFSPAYKNFQENLKQIGDPLYIEGKYFLDLEVPHSGWRTSKEIAGGGCIIDMGYHIIDLLIWYFGIPQAVYANLSHKILPDFKEIEDTAQISFSYKNGLHGSILISRFFYPKQEVFKVFGTKGSLTVSPSNLTLESRDGEKIKEIHFSSERQFNQIENFPIILRDKKKYDFCHVRYHLQHSAFIESCYLSHVNKKSINPEKILTTRKYYAKKYF